MTTDRASMQLQYLNGRSPGKTVIEFIIRYYGPIESKRLSNNPDLLFQVFLPLISLGSQLGVESLEGQFLLNSQDSVTRKMHNIAKKIIKIIEY